MATDRNKWEDSKTPRDRNPRLSKRISDFTKRLTCCIPHDKYWKKDAIEKIIDENTQQIKDLERVLGPKFEAIPALRDFPIHEAWRLCIDGRKQPDKGQEMPRNFFDEEPSFVSGVMKAFNVMLDGLGNKLTAESLEKLHDICVMDTFTEVAPGQKKSPFLPGYKGERLVGSFGLIRGGINCSDTGLNELDRKYACRKGGEEIDPRYGVDGHPVGNICLEKPSLMVDEKACMYIRPMKEGECQNTATRIINQYYKEIEHSGNEDDRLTAIVHCCQDLVQAHFFRDANLRTIAFTVLPKLLLENNLSPTIMVYPCDFGGKSVGEIKKEIRKGQEFFADLKNTA